MNFIKKIIYKKRLQAMIEELSNLLIYDFVCFLKQKNYYLGVATYFAYEENTLKLKRSTLRGLNSILPKLLGIPTRKKTRKQAAIKWMGDFRKRLIEKSSTLAEKKLYEIHGSRTGALMDFIREEFIEINKGIIFIETHHIFKYKSIFSDKSFSYEFSTFLYKKEIFDKIKMMAILALAKAGKISNDDLEKNFLRIKKQETNGRKILQQIY